MTVCMSINLDRLHAPKAESYGWNQMSAMGGKLPLTTRIQLGWRTFANLRMPQHKRRRKRDTGDEQHCLIKERGISLKSKTTIKTAT